MAGVGGVKAITFDCVSSGSETLTLVYGRIWLLNDALAPLKTNPDAVFDPAKVQANTYTQITINVN